MVRPGTPLDRLVKGAGFTLAALPTSSVLLLVRHFLTS
jgi:hypothetical protein